MMLPTAQRPPSTFAIPQLPGAAGRAVNRGAWTAATYATGVLTDDRSVNRFRARHGLPPVRDQLWHGRTQELGTSRLARHGIRRPAELRDAIATVVTDGGYTQRAREFATRLAAEDGVGSACDEVEDVLAAR